VRFLADLILNLRDCRRPRRVHGLVPVHPTPDDLPARRRADLLFRGQRARRGQGRRVPPQLHRRGRLSPHSQDGSRRGRRYGTVAGASSRASIRQRVEPCPSRYSVRASTTRCCTRYTILRCFVSRVFLAFSLPPPPLAPLTPRVWTDRLSLQRDRGRPVRTDDVIATSTPPNDAP
jgi:hypothetical protein